MSEFSKTPLAAAVSVLFASAGPALAQQQPEPALPQQSEPALAQQSQPALAQQQPETLREIKVTAPPEGQGFKIEGTRSATRTDTPLRDIPQFINVVPQEVIRSQGAMSFADALRNVPGITYGAAEGGTQANQVFFLRGFPVIGDIYLDGVRDLGEYNRDLFAIESVEVLKGPSALAFGRGSPGGVINQVPKYAELFSRKEVNLTLGSNGEKRIVGDLNLPLAGDNAFRLVALGEDSDTYRDTIENKQVGFAPSLRFGIGTELDVTLAYYYLKTRNFTDYGQPNLGPVFNFAPPPVSLKEYYGFANHDFTTWWTNAATARIDYKLSDSVSLRNITRWANYRREMEATIPSINALDANGNKVTAATPVELLLVNRKHDSGRTRDADDSVLINQTDITWKVATGAVRHTVLGGMEIAREELERRTYVLDADPATAGAQAPQATTPLLNPDPQTLLSYTKAPNQTIPAQADTLAFYVQDQMEFSKQWKALLGVRWDRLDSNVHAESTVTGEFAPNTSFSRVDEMWSGRGGIIWQPTDAQSYYIAAGNSYNPSGQLGAYGANGTSFAANTDNVRPEENRSYEIGAQWNFAVGVQLRAALFRNEKKNARTPPEPGEGTEFVLDGKRRVDGVELGAAGQITRDWDVYGNFAWMNGEIVKGRTNAGVPLDGNEPYGVPHTSGNIWTIYRLGGGWEIGGGAFYSSDWWLTDTNIAKAPSYTRWDATIAYVQKKYEVRLNVLNIFDEQYYLGGYENGGNRLIPGTPLTGLLTLTYRFD